MNIPTTGIPHKLLKCCLRAITFPAIDVCRLHLEEGHCTDMTGAIKFAELVTKHMPDFTLSFVETVSGEDRDTVYARSEDGEWVALDVNPWIYRRNDA
jgi:hypothetical protein